MRCVKDEIFIYSSRTGNAANARGYYRALRSLQTYIGLLNVVNRKLVFTWKLLSHFSEHPLFGIVLYMIFFQGSFIYSVMYEKGFKVPELIAQVRSAFRMQSSRLGNKHERKLLKRQVKSVPSVGIKVGEFHMLERTSTPVFLDYVVKNVANMLVTFKQLEPAAEMLPQYGPELHSNAFGSGLSGLSGNGAPPCDWDYYKRTVILIIITT